MNFFGVDLCQLGIAAMTCRGFQRRFYSLALFRLTDVDFLAIVVLSGAVLGIGWAEWR